jgi:predicted ATPase/class 3 adenylate cyclase
MQCPKCHSDCPPEFDFCPNCAAPLQVTCPQCSFRAPANFKFCPKCATALAAPTATPSAPTPPAADAMIERLLRQVPKEYAERLLATRGQPHDERRTVTILFSDVKGATAMMGKLDPEDAKEVIQGAFEFLIAPIFRYEGTLVQLMGDAILAFFGAPIAHEDDPERACRAGLEIIAESAEYAEKLKKERGIEGFNVRVGINTGLVVVGEVGSDLRVTYTAIGDAINLAARMEQNAPPGGILITHDTYRHVRGVFEVLPQEPLQVKGKSEAVLTYLVQRAKPRAFRLETRGVEGVETRTIGREAELHNLQDACFDAVEGGETRVAIVTGDAGVGKSRLLYEFLNWAELRPEHYYLFKGRAQAQTRATPYAVIRDLFVNRFEILETDSAATALNKFRAGAAGFLEPDRADLVGHLAGFDFTSSQAVSNLLGSPSFAQLATAYLLQYLRALAAQQPVVIALEDLHWADDSSLDLVDHIVTQMPKARLLFVCLARPALFERRPHWGEGREAYVLLALKALSRRHSRALVAEILKRVESIPDDLSDLIIDGAEGNPFYVEELIKMLIEEGVIVRTAAPAGAAAASNPELEAAARRGSATAPRVLGEVGEVGGGEAPWRVELPRLKGLHVPPTLTGVLQARLDSLPPEAREVLGRASVVGRIFWDGAVATLATEDAPRVSGERLRPLLDTARERELVFEREHSSFGGTQEYIFKHVILHDVTYETVLLKVRKVYHQQVAQWLEANARERVGEYAGLIAEHYERAGEGTLAAQWLGRVAEAAERSGAFREAISTAERALALLPEDDKAARAELLRHMGYSHTYLGNYGPAREKLNAALALAHEAGQPRTAAHVLCGLAFLALQQGAFADVEAMANEALALARAASDQRVEARALNLLGDATWDVALCVRLNEESLALRRKIGDKAGIASCLNDLGEAARGQGDYATAKHCYEESLAIGREIGNRLGMTFYLSNLGELAAAQNHHAAATRYHQEALAICQDIGYRMNAALCLGGLGHDAAATGDLEGARRYLQQALSEAVALGGLSTILYVLVGFARLKVQAGESLRAAEWLGLALNHPSSTVDVLQRAQTLLAELRAALPAEQLEAALARGAKLDLNGVVADILRDTEGRPTPPTSPSSRGAVAAPRGAVAA